MIEYHLIPGIFNSNNISSKEATKILEPEGFCWYNEFISQRMMSD